MKNIALVSLMILFCFCHVATAGEWTVGKKSISTLSTNGGFKLTVTSDGSSYKLEILTNMNTKHCRVAVRPSCEGYKTPIPGSFTVPNVIQWGTGYDNVSTSDKSKSKLFMDTIVAAESKKQKLKVNLSWSWGGPKDMLLEYDVGGYREALSKIIQ